MKTSSLKEMLDKVEAHERLIERITNPDDDFDSRADHEYERLREIRDDEDWTEYSENDNFNGE